MNLLLTLEQERVIIVLSPAPCLVWVAPLARALAGSLARGSALAGDCKATAGGLLDIGCINVWQVFFESG